MALIKWEPFADIDNFFETFPSISKFGGDLAVDFYEKDNNFVAEMSLPGINPENISVSVKDNYLRISGSREESKEEKRKYYYNKEIRRGSFERVIRLPSPVQNDKISAEFKNGELLIVLPKTTKEISSKVKIEIKK